MALAATEDNCSGDVRLVTGFMLSTDRVSDGIEGIRDRLLKVSESCACSCIKAPLAEYWGTGLIIVTMSSINVMNVKAMIMDNVI